MKKILISVLLMGLSSLAYAEFYKVEINRIDQNLYKTQEGIYIQTKYCYEYVMLEEAVLKYDRYDYDNKLIFENNESCDVEKVFK